MTTDTTGGWTAKDRANIEQVFGLVGGELMDEPWIVADAEGGHGWTCHFWYEFPPDYAQDQFDSTAHNYRTVVRDIMFGPPPEHLIDGDTTYTKVATFMNSGETECPGRMEDSYSTPRGVHFVKSADGVPLVRADQCDGGDRCYYCEEKIGEEHGYIYLGDGWAEIVYRELDEQDERNARTDLCDECKPVDHESCSLDPQCACCQTTLAQMTEEGNA